ncbi:uncharacterized protein LOC123226891 isoform X2 [Mangifera indica]|uniref:uncharacterized protein LOC123226891 isoform X2 n=1 Tax=Mangifera indica TaxID=29780 RepID=UPI001CFB7505|nr:uncharacterized protein LOC123226891 isoform X2 [Mangifera indica]
MFVCAFNKTRERQRKEKNEMGKIVERKKKRKGRPSLLDLQKRTLREEQQQSSKPNNFTQKITSNYSSAAANPIRRSTRRNPNPSPERVVSDDEDDELGANRREKKLKLVLKLQKSDQNSNSNASDSDENAARNHKKRKINAIGGGSGSGDSEKREKSISGTNPTNNNQGALLESGPSTPLPDKKLLLFILDRLQKKDTYGVFSEPVDPKELPDYHEVIERPMDFSTVRKQLSDGAYANLEAFEKDVFLICSNAMQYNAPDTIYFRQARSIQELAMKNFENLRQDSDDNELETKVIRRGRPPNKWKKPPGRPPLERARWEFPSDATLATGAENTIRSNYDLRKQPLIADKSGFAESSGRFYSSCIDIHSGLLAENKFERNDEVAMSRGYSMKHGKKQFVPDENRRNTYLQFHPSAGGREQSVFTTFNINRKQLMAVGLYSEHGYSRSLARFAASLGPVAWQVASKKIERCLPAEIKFGPGWVGENDVTPLKPIILPSTPQSLPSSNYSEKHVPPTLAPLDSHLRKTDPASAINSSSLFVANRLSSSEPYTEKSEVVDGSNSHTGFNRLNSSVGTIDTRPPIQIHQSPSIHPGMNGLNGTCGFNLPAQMGKLIEAAKSGELSFQPSQMLDRVSRINTNFVHPTTPNKLNSEDPKLADSSKTINHGRSMPNSESHASITSTPGHHRPAWQGLSPHPKPDSGLSPQQKSDSVPPDLNVRFHSPGSPSSSRVDSKQPDLALQL